MNLPAGNCTFVALLFFLAMVQGRPAAGAETRKITLSYSAVSMAWFPVKVAVEKGFFRNEGLEPQLIQMNGNVATSSRLSTLGTSNPTEWQHSRSHRI